MRERDLYCEAHRLIEKQKVKPDEESKEDELGKIKLYSKENKSII